MKLIYSSINNPIQSDKYNKFYDTLLASLSELYYDSKITVYAIKASLLHVQTETALTATNDSLTLQLATWAPTGNALIYVHQNNIFYRLEAEVPTDYQITDTGVFGTIYNGVPDWVYEVSKIFAPRYISISHGTITYAILCAGSIVPPTVIHIADVRRDIARVCIFPELSSAMLFLGLLERNETGVKADEKEQPVQERETYFLDILKSYSDKLTASSNGWFLLR
ncbi:venom dipeptidyl peptidase 4 isoform X2 [Vespula squamosa]|uniref:Venom dipeptidyl peptidase 4 isoform X2 n=1 Tax=Vespula squamosa TaxID=30214 RepID=A0ABD1ZX58_VESSQ